MGIMSIIMILITLAVAVIRVMTVIIVMITRMIKVIMIMTALSAMQFIIQDGSDTMIFIYS